MVWWAMLAWGGEEPSEHTVIYYNARMALREGESQEAVKLWLLRNALEAQTGTVSPHDADFRSVTWAALGDEGICQDGYPIDEDGAGLWPLALHNWVVRNMSRRTPPKRPRPFDAFELGRQQRFVTLGDVLSAEELRTVHLFRGRCLRARLLLVSTGEAVNADLSDRQVAARFLRYLLVRARATLATDHVRGQAAIEARLFDIDLQLTAMAAREAKQEARRRARRGREIGMSRASVTEMTEDAPEYTFSEGSEAAAILRASVSWPASEWMALSPERRLFLFGHARRFGGDPAALDNIALGIVDELTERRLGEQVQTWIAQVQTEDTEVIWGGDRGQRLLTLDRESGFQERSVIALHRGVHSLQEGDLPSALRSLAYALQFAPESKAADSVQSLSRRWMSYVAAQFAITDDLLVTLQELVPRRDYAIVLEDLMWRAAFHADRASFERGVHNQLGGDALERRIALLQPLAAGDVARFTGLVGKGLQSAPSETLRFVDQMLQRLELEDADVRKMHVRTLASLRKMLVPLASEEGAGGRGRTAAALVQRLQAILEGVGDLGPDATVRDSARSMAPTSEVFAGSVRLAPSDPLPWPFPDSEVGAPSIFMPIELTPEEWRTDAGEWVFGWSIGG
jgi:hypothetical protein